MNALHAKAECGFSLLEALFAVTLLGIVAMAISRAFVAQARANTQSEIRSEAVQAAQQVLDRLRTVDPASLPASGSQTPENIVVGNRTYSVVVAYCLESAFCSAATTRHIRATVNYRSVKRYEVDTVFAQLR
jgi:type II secretory pathway pseudopilin PulG